jgi:hypothetical protein
MIVDHTKIVMNDLNALPVPHYKKKSHHHDRRQDERLQNSPSRPIGDGTQKP